MAAGAITTIDVRIVDERISVLSIHGNITGASEELLSEAYEQASKEKTTVIILNFEGLAYMNSSGIGLLVTFLVRANRQKQRLLAVGLSDHYREIFELTRLNDAIGVYDDETTAIATSTSA